MTKEDFEEAKKIDGLIQQLNSRVFRLEQAKKGCSKSLMLKYTPRNGRGTEEVYITSIKPEQLIEIIDAEIYATNQEIANLETQFKKI